MAACKKVKAQFFVVLEEFLILHVHETWNKLYLHIPAYILCFGLLHLGDGLARVDKKFSRFLTETIKLKIDQQHPFPEALGATLAAVSLEF